MNSEKSTAQVYSREQYATKQFWDNRYKQKQSYFDWYAQFPQLKQTFETQYLLNPSHSILMLGCGNSKLSQQMYEAGYHNILNVDISPVVIEQMKKVSQQKGYDKMKWQVMDATNMHEIKDHTFDAIIDKGTLDALISGKNMDICEKMLRQSMRVLKKQGQFILITYGSPEGRKRLFQSAIGLSKYDYQFTRVDLSSMSTLINLMRSNLGNKPLNAITKDAQAMKKSLMEFNLIKVLRRNRKNEKKFIIWKSFQNKEVVFNQNQQPNNINTAIQQKKQSSSNQQPAVTQKVEQNKKSEQKVNYNPKKQSFCYVYSIKPKFAIDIEQQITQMQQIKAKDYQNGDKQVEGDSSLLRIGIYPMGCQKYLNKAILYLQKNDIANNPIIIYKNVQNMKKSNQQIKFILQVSPKNMIPMYIKTVFQIDFPVTNQLSSIEERIKNVCRELVENGGLQAHPSPKNYAYLGIIMQKIQSKLRFSEFLKQYWYPTYKLVYIKQNIVKYQISISPTIQVQYAIKQISSSLKIKQTQVLHVQNGYLQYYDPRVLGLANLCTMTYHDGESPQYIVEQYQVNSTQIAYTVQNPNLYFRKNNIAMLLARFLSAL